MNESVFLTWDRYLSEILPKESHVRKVLTKIGNVRHAAELQNDVNRLLWLGGYPNAYAVFNHLYASPTHIPHGKPMRAMEREELETNLEGNKVEIAAIKKRLDVYFSETTAELR